MSTKHKIKTLWVLGKLWQTQNPLFGKKVRQKAWKQIKRRPHTRTYMWLNLFLWNNPMAIDLFKMKTLYPMIYVKRKEDLMWILKMKTNRKHKKHEKEKCHKNIKSKHFGKRKNKIANTKTTFLEKRCAKKHESRDPSHVHTCVWIYIFMEPPSNIYF